MRIIADGFEISAGAAIDDQRLVAPAEQVAKLFVPPIETAGIGSQQPLHAGDQIRAGRFDDQMKMVRHQAPGMDLPAGFFTGLANVSINSRWASSFLKMGSRRSPRLMTW